MRLWSLHPRYLDPAGLVALWREGLLAQKVLAGETKGYRNHPQLTRFRGERDPRAAVSAYLTVVASEAEARGYSFDTARVLPHAADVRIRVTRGQLAYELNHLRRKVEQRRPEWLARLPVRAVEAHPLFVVVDGEVEEWERL